MQTFQTALDIAALIPPAIAVLLFLEYAWKRSAPTPRQSTRAGNVDEPVESILDILDPYGILEDLPTAGPEDCDLIEPTRTAEFLELVERKFDEADTAHQLAELAAGDEGFCREYDQAIATTPDPDWEPAWSSAALVMEQEPTTTVEVEEVSDPLISAFESPFDPNAMNAHRLRKECTKLKIKWRNAHGKGKHLSRDEMLEAIGRAIAQLPVHHPVNHYGKSRYTHHRESRGNRQIEGGQLRPIPLLSVPRPVPAAGQRGSKNLEVTY